MKLAILCGANPRAHKVENAGTIRVHAGRWKVVLEGVNDSDIALQHNTFKTILRNEQVLEFLDFVNARPEFIKRGVEDYVSVYLELVSGGVAERVSA